MVVATLAMGSTIAAANPPMDVGGVAAPSGTMVTGAIPISDTGDGVQSSIPITVINGASDGPVISLIAGIHGSEYAPILAMQQLAGRVDAASLRGAVIIVHIANLPAFRGRTIYFGPDDLKNLNRSFPGDAEGTVTERIADALTRHVMQQSDYLIDIHAGDANESLRPSYSAYYAEAGGDDVIRESQRLAVAFGLDTIVRFRGAVDKPSSAIYTSAQAVYQGTPAIDIESGELGSRERPFVDPIVDGTINVLRELEMIPGTAEVNPAPLYIDQRTRLNSEHDGIWYPSELVRTGDYVAEGVTLGVITDYHGRELAEIKAPASGILLILFGTPPVNLGDPLVVIGAVTQ